MKSLLILSYLVVGVITKSGGPLPEYMLGKYALETSEGFSDFMYTVNIGWFQRSVSE